MQSIAVQFAIIHYRGKPVSRDSPQLQMFVREYYADAIPLAFLFEELMREYPTLTRIVEGNISS